MEKKDTQQHTALRGAGAEADGWGDMEAHPHPLIAIRQEVPDLEADGVRDSQFRQFRHQSVGENCIECGAEVHEEQPCIARMLLQVGRSNG